MGFRFRKSIKLAPGVKINLGKRGASVSVGGRGASVKIGKKGAYLNTSLPGTGISARTKLSGNNAPDTTNDAPPTKQFIDVEIGVRGELIFTQDGEKAKPALVRALWAQKEENLLAFVKQEHQRRLAIDEDIRQIAGDVPDLDQLPPFIPEAFEKTEPVKPVRPSKIPRPTKFSPPRLSLFQLLSSQARKEQKARKLEGVDAHERAVMQWHTDVKTQQKRFDEEKQSFPQRLATWKSEKKEFEARQSHYQKNYAALIWQDEALMEQALESHLQALEWPRETLVDYHLDVTNKFMSLDVDLPEIEDLPQYIFTLDPSGRRLKSTKRKVTELRELYAAHVFGIAIRLAFNVFAQLPAIATVLISGYSQRPNKQTGIIDDEYLYSVTFGREKLRAIGHDLEPLALMDVFEGVCDITKNYTFKPIEPLTQ